MKFAIVLATCCIVNFVSAPAVAQVPAGLRGKTINTSYTSSTPYKSSEGNGVGSRVVARVIYVSTEGRIFVRATHRGVTAKGMGGARVKEIDPGQSDWRFVGGKLVSIAGTISGAVRVEISFDSAFQSCSVSGVIGHESGQPYRWKGLNGKQYEAAGPGTISGGQCSIASGNAL
jgi:hypothetical protein